jgi:hypothetical protein
MNYVNEPIRAFIRLILPRDVAATGEASNISVRLYNPLLVLEEATNPTEHVYGVYYYDFTPDELGVWLVVWDCSKYATYTVQVFDVIEDIVARLQTWTAQAF